MNQSAEYEFLENLCVPTMLAVLKEFLAPGNDFLSMNASLNISEGQLSNFAYDVLMEELMYDINNLAERDPAAQNVQNKEKYIWDSYKGLKAIMYYRIANHLINFENSCLVTSSSLSTEEDVDMIREFLRLQARKISERAATETTIEINPSAKIGKGFVIDHGVGTKIAPEEPDFSTVVGETCIIGEDCTLLNSVLLGAKVINEASTGKDGVATGKRHPTLGNHVTVCGGVRILGNINIGDNVTIGPCCLITTDIPDGYNVTIVNQLQYRRPGPECEEPITEQRPSIHGLTEEDNELLLFGVNLDNCQLSIVSMNKKSERTIDELCVMKQETKPNRIAFRLSGRVPDAFPFSLRIMTTSYEFILSAPQALNSYIQNMAQKGGAN